MKKFIMLVVACILTSVIFAKSMNFETETEREDGEVYKFEFLKGNANFSKLVPETEKWYLDIWRFWGYEIDESSIQTFEEMPLKEAYEVMTMEFGIPKKHRKVVIKDRLKSICKPAVKYEDKIAWLVCTQVAYDSASYSFYPKTSSVILKVAKIYEKPENEKLYKEYPLKSDEFQKILKSKYN